MSISLASMIKYSDAWPKGDVWIDWANQDNDWHSYTILAWNTQIGMVLLRGRSEGQADFSGRDFWTKISDIATIEEIKEEPKEKKQVRKIEFKEEKEGD